MIKKVKSLEDAIANLKEINEAIKGSPDPLLQKLHETTTNTIAEFEDYRKKFPAIPAPVKNARKTKQ